MRKYRIYFGGRVNSSTHIDVEASTEQEAQELAWDLVRTSGPTWDPETGEPDDIDISAVEELV